MADNIQLPTGQVVAADEVGGVYTQRNKVVWGDDGSVMDASLATPLPVQVVATAANEDSPLLVRLGQALLRKVEGILNAVSLDGFGRIRVVLDGQSGGSSLTAVTTVTTVATVTNLNQVAGTLATSFIFDQMHAAWCGSVRSRIN